MRKLQLICDLHAARIDAAVERVINKHSGPLVIEREPEPVRIPTHREALMQQFEQLRAAQLRAMAPGQFYDEQMARAQGLCSAYTPFAGLSGMALGYRGS